MSPAPTLTGAMVQIFSHYVPGRLIALVVLEALVVLIAACVGLSLHVTGTAGDVSSAGLMIPLQAVLFAIGIVIIMSMMGLYDWDAWVGNDAIDGRLAGAFLAGFLFVWFVSYLSPSLNPGPAALGATVAIGLFGIWLIRTAFQRSINLGSLKSRVLVLGTGSRVAPLVEHARRNGNNLIIGCLSLRPSTHYVPSSSVLTLGPDETLSSLVAKHSIDEIVVAVRDRRGGGLPVQQLLECKARGVKVVELATYFEREYRQVMLDSLNPSWMVLGDGFRQGLARRAAKRIFDLAASVILLVVTVPFLLVAALLIYLESGRPVFYRQERVGQGGRIFKILKLRSMKHDAEPDGNAHWARANDDRTTAIGRFIRKWRMDELPQIYNVLRGEMSFVGPRPERPVFVERLEKQIPYYALRHSAKPGITGWAQVRYAYGASVDDAIEKLQYDLYYVKNRSLFLDLMILLATVEVVLWGRGAR
jgi:sugar transferase (PEP-CTERM system associated)